jgi:hypothetical protein
VVNLDVVPHEFFPRNVQIPESLRLPVQAARKYSAVKKANRVKMTTGFPRESEFSYILFDGLLSGFRIRLVKRQIMNPNSCGEKNKYYQSL